MDKQKHPTQMSVDELAAELVEFDVPVAASHIPEAVTFKSLAIGKTFRFAEEEEVGFPGAHGPWIKITPRKYIDENGFREYEVGSISVAVVEVAARG